MASDNNRDLLGLTIKTMRESRNMTQAELGKAIGKNASAISNYEHGTREPDFDTLEAMADAFNVPMSAFIVNRTPKQPFDVFPVENVVEIPVVGTIRCGPGGLAMQEIDGYMPAANVKNPSECFYLRIVGDSMAPRIQEGDLALVRRQPDVESGELAAVVIDGEEGTLKKVIKKQNAIILQAFNPAYPPRVFTGDEIENVCIAGKVIRTEAQW